MSGRVYLAGVGLALVALGLGFTDWALTPPPGVSAANVRRIRSGMTLAEVEGILGGPAGATLAAEMRRDGAVVKRARYWNAPAGIACVIFDSRGRAVDSGFDPETIPGEVASPLSRLRAWLGW